MKYILVILGMIFLALPQRCFCQLQGLLSFMFLYIYFVFSSAKISEISSTLGRPYKFAQQFCLVPNEKETDECRHDRFKYFLKTMLRIGDRIKARSVLDVTCRNATALKPLDSLSEEFQKLIPKRDVCMLTSFKAIKSEEILSTELLSSRQQSIITRLFENGQLENGFQFIAGIEQDGKDRVYAFMHIPRAYVSVFCVVYV